MKKERLDTLLVARGLASGRERAKRLIMAGQVLVDERRIDKAGTTVDADAHLRVVGEDLPYVSRGGLKLAKGMSTFGIVLTGKAAADIGASTGGFTDCMPHGSMRSMSAMVSSIGSCARMRGSSIWSVQTSAM